MRIWWIARTCFPPLSCSSGNERALAKGAETRANSVKPVLIGSGRKAVHGSLPDPCGRYIVDYRGIYPVIDTLPAITGDSIYIDTLLKKMGMKQVHFDRGNWQLGPQMMNMTLGTCTCTVSKAYFFNRMLPDSAYDLRVIERVICNVPDTLPGWIER